MDLFVKGQKIALYIPKQDALIEMICTIDDVMDDRLVINPPQYFMRYVDLLQEGCSLTAKAFSKLGTIDFNTMVISSPLEENFVIELDYNAVQLSSADENIAIGAVEHMEIKNEKGTFKVKTFELSANYVKFSSNAKFAIDSICECTVSLPGDYGIINFKGVISDIDPIYENEYTVTYITITEKDKQALMYYMYMYSNDT